MYHLQAAEMGWVGIVQKFHLLKLARGQGAVAETCVEFDLSGANMKTIFEPTWIAGTPRGFGGNQDWRHTVASAVEGFADCLAPSSCLAVSFEFRINPESDLYGGQNLPHGTDLDNMIKETLDAMLPHGGPVDDSMVYQITATKVHVASDDEAGVLLEVHECNG